MHFGLCFLTVRRGIVESRQNLSVANNYFRCTIYGINHCFQVISISLRASLNLYLYPTFPR
jgi:hypothetical protein